MASFTQPKALFQIVFFLGLVYLCNQIAGRPVWFITLLFDLDRENAIPGWFSTFLWILCSLTAWEISENQNQGSKKRACQGIAAVFLFFSADETAMIHERLSQTVNHLVPLMPVHNVIWPITLFPLLLILFSCFLWAAKQIFDRRQPAHWKILAGLGLFLFGAVGVEMALIFWHSPFFQQWEFLFVYLEETCEMLGTILILSGLLEEEKRLKLAATALHVSSTGVLYQEVSR
jgi:hypothetical protein